MGARRHRWHPLRPPTTSGSIPSTRRRKDPVFPDDYVEIGNDVYMQYRKTETGYVPARKQERRYGLRARSDAALPQWAFDGYKTDLFLPVIEKLEEISGKKYDEDEEARKAMRIIADHTRTTVMLIGDKDGIPALQHGRGYILRRIMRRAIRYCRQLGVRRVPF